MHKLRTKSIRDVFFDPKRRTVRLKKEDTIDKTVSFLRGRDSSFIKITSWVLMVAIVSAYSFSVRADMAEFYPSTCLGDWHNTDLARGGRDVDIDSESEAFTSENSAVLQEPAGRIYCSSFVGDLPDDAQISNVTIALSFAYKEPIVTEVNQEAITTEGALDANFTASTTIDATTTPDSSEEIISDEVKEVEVEKITETETVEKTEVVEEETVEMEVPKVEPEPVPEPITEPVSWLFESTKTAFAQEIASSSLEIVAEEIVTEEIVIEEVVEASTTVEIEAEVVGEVLAEATTTLSVPVTEEIVISGEESTEEEKIEIAEIMYTIDGDVWNSVGSINADDENGAKFVIPLISLSDIANIQVSVQAIDGSSENHHIYLDSIWLEVSYELPPPPREIELIPATQSEGIPRIVYESQDSLFPWGDYDKDEFKLPSSINETCVVTPVTPELAPGDKANYEVKLSNNNPFRLRFGDLVDGSKIENIKEITDSDEKLVSFDLVTDSNATHPGTYGMVLMYDSLDFLGKTQSAQCSFSVKIK